MEILFWLAVAGVFYAYAGYPLLLWIWHRLFPARTMLQSGAPLPTVSILIPAHNEQAVIGAKLRNCLDLDYPAERLQIVVVSDGSSDNTNAIITQYGQDPRIKFLAIDDRRGKANALNVALQHASGDIIVFTDASISLDRQAIRNIVAPFADERIGCVSGEDYIPEGGGGEGLYGRYELFLRRLESGIGSIVGASGSLYAQRRILCEPFPEGLAPDFLSVLNTVEHGYRAVSEPSAFGTMSATKSTADEFRRKVRTLVRGMAAIAYKRGLLNVFRYPVFAMELWSHKIFRWLVPLFLVLCLVANMFLAAESAFYAGVLVLQTAFYLGALVAGKGWIGLEKTLPGKVPLYFTVVNLAILAAWLQFLQGARVEIWQPTKRTE